MRDWNNIYDEYPQLFQNPADTRYGHLNKVISCGKGWYNIINNVCKVVDQHIKNNPRKEQIKILQIKEKFGILTIYVQNGDEYIKAINNFAKTISSITCEYCGEEAKITKLKTGWLKTICNRCKEEERI